jgi:hypothetical protein
VRRYSAYLLYPWSLMVVSFSEFLGIDHKHPQGGATAV